MSDFPLRDELRELHAENLDSVKSDLTAAGAEAAQLGLKENALRCEIASLVLTYPAGVGELTELRNKLRFYEEWARDHPNEPCPIEKPKPEPPGWWAPGRAHS